MLYAVAAFCMVSILPATATLAQSTAIERNLPDEPDSPGAAITVDEHDFGAADERPLGVDLAGIELIGPGQAISAEPGRGVAVGDIPNADRQALEAALSPFIGQPLSLALVARMQAEVARVWREDGHPFMSVTAPPQELTAGVLTLRVVEFSAGRIEIDPQGDRDAGLRAKIRQQPGARIGAEALSEDLDWVNRNPFRHVEAVFAPGDEQGASDIRLDVTARRPVSMFASWDNTGNEATGRERWSVGGGAWIPELNDMTVSYRFTRSDEFWDEGELFSLDGELPGYLSHAGRIDLPTWPRQALSVMPNYVETNELVSGTPFSFRNKTFELPIRYRSAVSSILPGRYWGDVYVGVEPKWISRDTSFAGVPVADAEVGLVNLVVGWSHRLVDSHGRTEIDLRLKANPGRVISTNTAADWAAFTGGRVTDNTYVHAGFDIARLTRLPRDFLWSSRLSGLIAGQALPDTERLSLGGFHAVRGYDGNDGSVDAGLVWRNEIRLPTLALLGNAGVNDSFSPFAFLDLGFGRDIGLDIDVDLASTGLGFDYAIGSHLAANLTAAVALTDSGETRSGDVSILGSIRVTY